MGDTGIRVLLIEDNPGDARLVYEMLRSADGVSIDTVGHLAEARARLSEPGIDLVLLDLGLPDSRGLETLTSVRSHHPDLPVIVLTGLDDEALALEAVRAGAQDYLVKGRFDDDSLPRAIRYATERQRAETALRESEARHRAVVQSANDAIISSDSAGLIVSWNPGAERIFGYAETEACGQPITLLMPARYAKTGPAAMARVLSGGESGIHGRTVEVEGLRRDGSEFPLELSVSTWQVAGEMSFTAIVRDITERKRAEEALRDNEATLVEAQAIAKIGSWELDVTKTKPRWSREMFTIFDRDPALGEPEWKEHRQSVHPEDWDRINQAVVDAIEDGLPYREEMRIVRRDGSIVWGETIGQVHRMEGGQVVELSGTVQDITERKQAEVALQYSENRFRDIADHAQEWIWEIDAEGTYTYASQMGERILGYKAEEMLQKHFYDLFHPDDRQSLKEAALEVFATKQPFREFVNRNVHKNGRTVWLATSGIPLLDEAGTLLGYRGVDTDITERKRSEEELRNSEAALLEAQTTAKIGSWEYDVTKDGPVWSREMFRILDRDPALGEPKWTEPIQTIHAQDREQIDRAVEKAIKGYLPYREEFRIVRRDGSVGWGETIGRVRRMETGQVTGLSGTVQDITDRKLAELALIRRVDEMEALYQTSLQAVAQGDLQALLKTVVESAARLTGGDRGALYLPTPDGARLRLHISFNLGRDYTGAELVMGEGVSGRAALERRTIMVEDYSAWEGKSSTFRDSGIGRVLAVPMQIGDRLTGVLNVADLSTGSYGEDEIRLVSLFAEQAAMAIESARLLDETSRRASYLEALTGTAEALGAEVVPQVMYAKVLEEVTRQLRAEGASLSILNPDGLETETVLAVGAWEETTGMRLPVGTGIVGSVTLSGVPFVSEDVRGDPRLARPELLKDMPCVACVPLPVEGRPIGCLMVGRHASLGIEEVRLLTGLAEIAGNAIHRARVMATLEERVRQRTQELETANERLQDLDRMKTEFVSNVTHELRTPITNVMLYLDLARRSASETKRSHYFDVLKSESVRLGTLIESVLTLSRLERGTISMELEPQPLDALLADVRVAHQARADAKGITLDHEPDGVLPVAWVNRLQMHQVLSNLVGNAVAYAPRDAIIVLGTARRQVGGKEFVGAVVHNTGTLIRPDDMSHLFERFYRGDVGRESGEPGTGLGLAISKEIVERHHGWIDVESGEKAGTTFSVWLPTEPQA